MRSRRNPARWLAPLALMVVVGSVLLMVNRSEVGAKGARTSTPATITGASQTRTTAASRPRRPYVVRGGDTLSGIAAKTGVALAVIERLNPDIDAQTLRTGQKIKLSP